MANHKKKNRKAIKEKRKLEKQKAEQKKEQKKKQQEKEKLAKSNKLSENDYYNEYYDDEKKKALSEYKKIVDEYETGKTYINLVDKQTFMQLEPQFQAEEFIKAYDYVLNGLTSAKNLEELDYKGIKSLQHDIELYDTVYNIYMSGNDIPTELKKNLYIMYNNLKHLSQLVHVGTESRAEFEEYQAAKDILIEDKMNYTIFKLHKQGKSFDHDFDWFKGKFYERMKDVMAQMGYSSDQAVDYMLTTDYDVYSGEGGINVIADNISKPKYEDYEKKAKEEAQTHTEYMKFKNAQLIKIINETQQAINKNDLENIDILRLKSSEFAKYYEVVNYNSKNDSKVIGDLKVALEDYENPKEIMKYLIDSLRVSTSIVQTNNKPTIQDLRYFTKMLERGIKIDEQEAIELEFGTNNVNVENKEEEEYGDIL